MADWQPIDTAPKDGTRVLTYHDPHIYVLAWSSEATGRLNWNDGEYTFSPTHWMPLPDPPKESA